MELDYFEIGRNIRKFRIKAGLKQKELAELINVSSQHISHIENGHTKLSLPILVMIANTLSVDCNSLLGSTLVGAQDMLMSKELLLIYTKMDARKQRLCIKLARTLAEDETEH